MNADGSSPMLLMEGMASARSASWTPDGRIVFEANAGGDVDIFVVNADGTGLTNLTSSPGILELQPAWSP